MTIKELVAQYEGDPDKIPNEPLYEFLSEVATRAALVQLLSSYKKSLKAAAEEKDKVKKEEILKVSKNDLEIFKNHPFVASVRKRCKRNLEWLVCYFCWETNPEGADRPISDNRITRESHGPILDFFVKKDDTKSIADQDTWKLRLLLWPRGGMKSTIDVVDSVQWILNFPEVRILYLTGDDDLAVGFVDETKSHFVEKRDEPSLMNLFFPEFCVQESKMGNEFEFTCPVWADKQIIRKEPTVQAASITSSLSGRHYEVVKADDAITNRNTENEEQCRKIAKKISVSARPGKMLRPFGYFDAVGTRYHDDDYYGLVIENNVGDLSTINGDCWSRIENKTTNQLVLIGRAIVIKPEIVVKLEKEGRPVNYREAGADGCYLLLPKIMPYSFLMGEYNDDEETFEGQLNQNPRSLTSTTFDKPLLLRNTLRFDEMPYRGPISQTWDFAGPFNNKKGRDYCTASCGIWDDKGTCYIQDIIRSRFKPNDLAKAVVDFAVKYHPFVIGIEDGAGAQWLEPAIITEAQKTNDLQVIAVCSKIDWITPDNQKDAKKMRMSALHPWLINGRLKFANYLPFLQVLYDEFEKCLHSARHDDIPDVISYQPRYAPRVQQMVIKTENTVLMSPDRAHWNILYEEGSDAFGRIGFGQPSLPLVPLQPEPDFKAETACPDYDPILGAGFPG